MANEETKISSGELRKNLITAVKNKELEVYYQPKIDVKTGNVVSAEALLRWNSPTLGIIQPSTFIPIAEETGIILEIGEMVLREACMQNRIWHESGLGPIKVAVNMSSAQLYQRNIVKIISEMAKEKLLQPECLEIEITESIEIDDFEYASNVIEKFKKLGIKIFLDDFGTGFSCLNYLRKLPIDYIKIDRTFISDMITNEKDSFIVSSIINFAHGINIGVVAEGAETIEQIDMLKSYGCDEIQGYYYSKPITNTDFEKYLYNVKNKTVFSNITKN